MIVDKDGVILATSSRGTKRHTGDDIVKAVKGIK